MSTARNKIAQAADSLGWTVNYPLLAKDPYMYRKGVFMVVVWFGPRGGLYGAEMYELDDWDEPRPSVYIGSSGKLETVLEWFKD